MNLTADISDRYCSKACQDINTLKKLVEQLASATTNIPYALRFTTYKPMPKSRFIIHQRCARDVYYWATLARRGKPQFKGGLYSMLYAFGP